MREVVHTKKFIKDLKRVSKRRLDLTKIEKVIDLLARDGKLAPKYKPHPLIGNWFPYWECHVQPDWLLIYQVTDTEVVLFRTGTHSDLF